ECCGGGPPRARGGGRGARAATLTRAGRASRRLAVPRTSQTVIPLVRLPEGVSATTIFHLTCHAGRAGAIPIQSERRSTSRRASVAALSGIPGFRTPKQPQRRPSGPMPPYEGSPVRVTRTCRLTSSVAGTLLSSSGHDAANVYCSDRWCGAPGRDRIGRRARSPWISRTHRTPGARLSSHLLGRSHDNRREASPVATHVRHRHSRGTRGCSSERHGLAEGVPNHVRSLPRRQPLPSPPPA